MKDSFDRTSDGLSETALSSKEIFNGRILHIYDDTVRLPNGETAGREVIRHVGAVCVSPVTDDGNVIVEKQFRYPIDEVICEIPAGKLESKNEDRLEAAKRELLEETGISADNWRELGVFYPAPAYSDEKITMYVATSLHYGERSLDDDEFLDVESRPLSELVDEVMSGKITDAKTQIAVLKAAKILGI